MGYQLPFYSPFSGQVIPTAYAWIGELNMNFDEKRGRIVLMIHESKDAKDRNCPPIGQLIWTPGPSPIPATDTEPEFPSFDSLVLLAKTTGNEPAGTPLFGMVKAAFYQFLKTRPQLANAVDLMD